MTMRTLCALLLLGMAACSSAQNGEPAKKQLQEVSMSEDMAQAVAGLSLNLKVPGPYAGVGAVPDRMAITMTLHNEGEQTASLQFRSGQSFELELYSDGGELLYRWSEGKMFTQALRDLSMPPGEEQSWTALIPASAISKDGAVAAGAYTVKMQLKARMMGNGRTFALPIEASAPLLVGLSADGAVL